MRRGSTIDEAWRDATERLRRAGVPDARREARWLLASLIGTDGGGLLARKHDPIPRDVAERYDRWIERRSAREPAQHLIGRTEFRGLEFAVDRRVLVPRPETEGLVDAVLGLPLPERAEVLDVGAGSGCIAVTLAVERPEWRLFALDRSADALDVARANAERHGVADRVVPWDGDLAALPAVWTGRFDGVVSNPPYVAEAEWLGLEPEVRDHDPRLALVAGPSGLEAYRALVPQARRVLRDGGWLALELGYAQHEAVAALVRDEGFDAVAVRDDLRGIPRVLTARRSVAPARGGS